MATNLVVAATTGPDAAPVLSETKERKLNLRQRIEKLLRQMFEGHEELLGITPD